MSALLNNTLAKEPTMNAFARSMENLIGFLFMGGILIGGLIAANKMGIAGADRALALGKKWGGGAVNWAKRTSMRPVKALGTTARAGALTAGAKLFGKESRIGRRMGARADQLRQAAAERPEHKKYRAMAERMSDTNILKEVETAKGPRAFIATQIAEKRGLLREEADRSTVRAGMRALRASGAQEEARRLEEFRPDAIENKNERTAAEQRAFKEGIHKKWSGKVLEGARGAEIIEEMRGQLGTGEFTKVYKGWARNVKDKAEQALRANFTANFTDRNNMERRKVYAEATGEPNRAFFGDQNGVIQTTYRADPNAQNQARIHIRSLKDEGIGELKTNDDKALAAAYMIPSQVYGAGTKLSGRDKRLMKLIAKKYNPDPETHARMVTADTWK